MQIVPLRFCHDIGTKRSVLWPSKYAKIRFRPGLCPLVAGEGTLLPIPHPTRHRPTFGARHASPRILARSTRMAVMYSSLFVCKRGYCSSDLDAVSMDLFCAESSILVF